MTEKYLNNHYNKDLKEFARNLRNNSTLTEVILWNKILKQKKLRGYSFLRQRPIKNYIVDFFSKDLKLVIEIDGKIHKFQKQKDKKREEEIRDLGFSFIRFQNEEILHELFNVQRTLESFVDEFEKRNMEKLNRNNLTPLSPQEEIERK